MATLTRLTALLRTCRALWTRAPYDPDDSAVVEYQTADGYYYRTKNGVYYGTGT
jgi:hypothetical protein